MSVSKPLSCPEPRAASEYSILKSDACDPELRNRVIHTINPPADTPPMTETQRAEVAAYITQLEDALLRHHWGAMHHHQVLEILKCATGLDIEGRAAALESMISEDA